MADIWYAHFDSTPDDRRLLSAEDWAKYNRSLFTDGIRNGGASFEVRWKSGMNIEVMGGIASIQGYIFRVDADINGGDTIPLTLSKSSPIAKRYDRVVLRLDRRIEKRCISVAYKPGTAGSVNPPVLERNDNIWELSLATITVAMNMSAITQLDIKDDRYDNSLCGIMSTLMQLDSSSWQTQVNANITSQKSVWDAELNTRKNSWDTALTAKKNEWTTELNGSKALSDAQRTAIDNWLASVQMTVNGTNGGLNFDIVSTKIGFKTDTVFGNGVVTETVTVPSSGTVIGRRTTTFTAGGVNVTEQIYNTSGGLIRTTTVVTTFNANGTITATCT